MAPLPLFKLGALLAKQISKPLARIIKEKSLTNSFLKTKVVIPVAQTYHRLDIAVRMKLLGLGSPDKVPALNEKQAIELGAELMSEFFVFGTAVAAILLEYLRQSKKTENKSNQMSSDIESLNTRNEQVLKDIEKNLKLMSDLKKGIDEQKSDLKKLNSRIHLIEDKFKTNLNEISSQTSDEKPIGKIMYPSNSAIKPNADVRNSIIYQAADDAIISLIQKSID